VAAACARVAAAKFKFGTAAAGDIGARCVDGSAVARCVSEEAAGPTGVGEPASDWRPAPAASAGGASAASVSRRRWMRRAGEPASCDVSADGLLVVGTAPMAVARAIPVSPDPGAPMTGADASGPADDAGEGPALVTDDGARWVDGTYVTVTGAKEGPAMGAEEGPAEGAEDGPGATAGDGPTVAADRRARVSGAAWTDPIDAEDGVPEPLGGDGAPRAIGTPSADPSPRGADEILVAGEAAATGPAAAAEVADVPPGDGCWLTTGAPGASVDSSCAGSSGARCMPGAGLAASGAPSPALRDWASVSLAGRPDAAVGDGAVAAR
jgi:hypothetical protein